MENKSKRIKKYIVCTNDTWDNYSWVGVFLDLKNAEEYIKEQYREHFPVIKELSLVERASTFNWVFDDEVYEEDSGEFLRVFGWIYFSDEVDTITLDVEDPENPKPISGKEFVDRYLTYLPKSPNQQEAQGLKSEHMENLINPANSSQEEEN